MKENKPSKRKVLKDALKANIKKAWYQLDKKSFEKWLEGRTVSGNELRF